MSKTETPAAPKKDEKPAVVTTDLPVPAAELDGVRGGKTPTATGPIPIPYPL
jgi:hypothetical protein